MIVSSRCDITSKILAVQYKHEFLRVIKKLVKNNKGKLGKFSDYAAPVDSRRKKYGLHKCMIGVKIKYQDTQNIRLLLEEEYYEHNMQMSGNLRIEAKEIF